MPMLFSLCQFIPKAQTKVQKEQPMFLHSLKNDLPNKFKYDHFYTAAVTLNYLSLKSQVTLKKKGMQKYDDKKYFNRRCSTNGNI